MSDGSASARFVSLVPDTRPTPRTVYERHLHAVLDDLFAMYPTFATSIGYHALDDRWPDTTPAGRGQRVALVERWRERTAALDEVELEPHERIDRGILLDALANLSFEEATLREDAWDPLSVVTLLGHGLFGLLAREYGPWAHRGRAFLGRLLGLPDVIEGARASLGALSERPVSLLHLETALQQLDGIPELIELGLAEATARAEAGESPHLPQELEAARPAAEAAVAALRTFLDEQLRPRADGEGRLGEALFRAKLAHTLGRDLEPEALLAKARRDYAAVRDEMRRLAAAHWGAYLPREAPPADPDRMVARLLDVIAAEHPQPHELLDWCQAEVSRLEAFVRQRDLVGLPDEPLRVTWTPRFLRAYGGAFLEPAGPLERGEASFFWITPPDEAWPPERVESYLREDNARMLRLLCIHEGVPGHYLQLAWANRSPSLTRAVFASGLFAEGWAVYVTQVMMDLGYGADDPALLLTHWKFYLRSIINTILDVAIHTGGMTEQEALELMIQGGWQEEHEATAKWLRARLTATQLCTYYLGSLEMWDLEMEARRREAAALGAGPQAIPAASLVGGLGATPGFVYRTHLESVLEHGTPPPVWLRRILFGSQGGPDEAAWTGR